MSFSTKSLHFLRLLFALVGISALLLVPPALSGKAVCHSDWSHAATLVKKEGLVTVEDLAVLTSNKINGKLIKTNLCAQNDEFFYQLVVRMPGGQLKTVKVDARKPFQR